MNRNVLPLAVALAALSSIAPLAGCKRPAPPPETPPADETATAAAKAAEEAAAAAPKPAAAGAANRTAGVIVLCYHRFEEKPRDGMAITPAEFRQELQQIKDQGFTVIPMADFLAWRRDEKTIPEKSCVITIDDGYRSVAEVGKPILDEFGYPFTMFIYTDFVKGQPRAGGGSLSWEELAALRDAGVDIQSHSVTHADLRSKKGKSAEDYQKFLEHELVASRQMIEQQLGVAVKCFAYPYGNNNEEVRKAALAAGYEAAFSVYGQRIGFGSPPDQIGRYAVDGKDPKIFQAAVRMVGGGVSASYAATATAAAAGAGGPAPGTVATEPANGATITNLTPLITADLSSFGEIDAGSVEMRMSGLGVVPVKFDAATKKASFQVTQKIRDKSCTVILGAKSGGKKIETRWTFNVDHQAAAPAAR